MGMRRIVLLLASMALAVIFGSGVALADSPTTKEDCKKGGYAKYGFKNQGQCIEAVKLPPPAPLAPDRIVFSTTRFDGTSQLPTMNPDGRDVQPITSTSGPPQEFTPAISPDGTGLADVSYVNVHGVLTVDGTLSMRHHDPDVATNGVQPDGGPE